MPLSIATSIGGDITKFSDTGFAAYLPSAFLKCSENMLSADRIHVRLTVAFTLGSAVLQGHAGLGVVALRLH